MTTRTDEEMDDLIDAWNKYKDDCPLPPLHEYLGMTEHEYAAWVEGRKPEHKCKGCGDTGANAEEWWGLCVSCAKKNYKVILELLPPQWSTDDMFDGVPEDMAKMIATFCSRQQTGHCTCARLVDIWRGEDPILLAEKRGGEMQQLREKFDRVFHGK